MKQGVECEMILQKDYLAEVACQVDSQERPLSFVE